jgi:hypothetical protein
VLPGPKNHHACRAYKKRAPETTKAEKQLPYIIFYRPTPYFYLPGFWLSLSRTPCLAAARAAYLCAQHMANRYAASVGRRCAHLLQGERACLRPAANNKVTARERERTSSKNNAHIWTGEIIKKRARFCSGGMERHRSTAGDPNGPTGIKTFGLKLHANVIC